MINSTRNKVSIIIPVKNEGKNIKDALDSLIENNILAENIEVIVVDGHSKDDTVKIASNYPVKILYESIGTRAGACNVGWRNSNGNILVFTDADCLFLKNWIRKIVNSFEDSKVAAVGGIDLTSPTSTSYIEIAGGVLEELRAMKEKDWYGSAFHLRGCNVAYTKEALVKCGGFDNKFKTAEESELQYRLHKMGYKLIFNPSIKVYHKRRSTLKGYLKQFYYYGFGEFQLIQKHPSLFFIPDIFILLCITLLFFSSIILISINRNFFSLILVIFLIYMVGIPCSMLID